MRSVRFGLCFAEKFRDSESSLFACPPVSELKLLPSAIPIQSRLLPLALLFDPSLFFPGRLVRPQWFTGVSRLFMTFLILEPPKFERARPWFVVQT